MYCDSFRGSKEKNANATGMVRSAETLIRLKFADCKISHFNSIRI